MIFLATAFLFALGFTDARPKHSKSVWHTNDGCPSGVHIVGVRGTLEDPGHGELQGVVDGVKAMYPGSDDYAIEYPAGGIEKPEDDPNGKLEWNLVKYLASEAKGYKALKSHLEDYYEKCPETPIVIMGYSQGAHVVGDTLCGNTNAMAGLWKAPIKSPVVFNIVGVISLGDPTNYKKISWHQGNGTYSGMFIRTDYRSCRDVLETYGQSWCDEKDFFCEFAHWGFGGSTDVHLLYVKLHKEQILALAKERIDDAGGLGAKFISQGFDL